MIYERYAAGLSAELFNAIYMGLKHRAELQQRQIYARCKPSKQRGRAPKEYYVGEAQDNLNAFCNGNLSLGAAMDYIANTRNA